MTATYADQTFKDLRSIGLAPTINGLEFERCKFDNCMLRTDDDPARRALVKNVVLKKARLTSSLVSGVILQDCVMEHVTWDRVLIVTSCAFEHVTLKGKIGDLWVRSLFPDLAGGVDYSRAHAFDAANAKFYEHIDWALDIREVEVTRDLQIDGVPIHLIRRDPARHVVLRRAKALEGRWRDYDLSEASSIPVLLRNLVESGPEAKLFVIPDKNPRRERIVAAVKMLREAGIAEPD